jgi:hypothetical protein
MLALKNSVVRGAPHRDIELGGEFGAELGMVLLHDLHTLLL